MKNNSLHYRISIIIVLIIICLTPAISNIYYQKYPGTNLRGRIMLKDDSNNLNPFRNTQVDIYKKETTTSSWTLVASTKTNNDGFFYFQWIIPGNYFIQVNRNKNYKVSVIKIDYTNLQFQDLPVVHYQ